MKAPRSKLRGIYPKRLKKYPSDIQKQIFANQGSWIELHKEKHCKQEIAVSDHRRLIVTYNEKRARKDRKGRERMIEKMRKRLGQSKNPKKLVTNRGYAKFVRTEGEVKLTIDEEKLAQEAAWDGFHGVITNDTSSQSEELLLRYRRLWVIEECFRIQKHTLSVRPIFHWKPERIQAHVLLCYMAFTLVRHAEWRIQVQQKGVSIQDIR